jgi:hypothetical protein
MNSVLDPTLFIISTDEFYDEDRCTVFFEHIEESLKAIKLYGITRVYWFEELDAALMDWLNLPKTQEQFNSIIPRLYEIGGKYLFSTNNNSITTPFFIDSGIEPCSITPSLSCENNIGLYNLFLKMFHHLIIQEENVFLCLSKRNSIENQQYEVSCECHSNVLLPLLIKTPSDWFFYIDLENEYWPTSVTDENIEQFKLALEFFAHKKFPDYRNSGFLYDNYEFTNNFIKDIMVEFEYRKEIFYSITKRLMLPQKLASKDQGLNDEDVKGKKTKKRERRFRVTGELRIHYVYQGKREICFTNYYRKGKHDEGL